MTGDVFVRDDGVYYLISTSGEVVRDFTADEYFVLDEEEPFVEIGGIGDDVVAPQATLPQLASDLDPSVTGRCRKSEEMTLAQPKMPSRVVYVDQVAVRVRRWESPSADRDGVERPWHI